jgi:hypothetical protein
MDNEIEREVNVECGHCGEIAWSGIEWRGLLCNVDGPNGMCCHCGCELCEGCSQPSRAGVPYETKEGKRQWLACESKPDLEIGG